MQLNYYERLGISPSASTEEIKAAFRRKIKSLHPDVSSLSRETTWELSQVIQAYEILSKEGARKEYTDGLYIYRYRQKRFNYREFLISRLYLASSWGKLILFEFLHYRNSFALELFETYKELHSLYDALERDDYLDCLVFLGEEYLTKKKYEDAFCCFEKIIIEERKRPYFKHFMVEIYRHVQLIVGTMFPKILAKERLAVYTNRIQALQIPKSKMSLEI